MNIKSLINNKKERFRELLDHKIFRYAVIVHSFYFILSFVLFFTFFYDQNDFVVFYTAGKTFFQDITNLYSQENYYIHFRYFPLSATFYIPFSLFNFDLGYILFNFFNLFLTFLTCIVLYKIIFIIRGNDHEKGDDRIILYISLFLMAMPHIDNYILGQVNLQVTLLILLSLFIFIKYKGYKWQLIGGLLLGISINIKPSAIFIVPFLIVMNFTLKKENFNQVLKVDIIRLIGTIIPLSLNIIFFLIYPSLWDGFLLNNFGGHRTIDINFSFSITKLIINFCSFYGFPFNQTLIFLIITGLFGGIGLIFFFYGRNTRDSIIYGFTLGIIILLLVYFDSWDHHLLILIPMMILIIFNLPRKSKITKKFIKPSFFFFCFIDLAFLGIWHLTESWFPFNFMAALFLIITFYGISRYIINPKQE